MNTLSTSYLNSETHLSFFRSLRGKLFLLLLSISLIPFIIVGVLVYLQAKTALENKVIQEIVAVRDIKADQIENYFNERRGDVKVLSNNLSIVTAIHAFIEAIEVDGKNLNADDNGVLKHIRSLYLNKSTQVNVDDGSAYSIVHAQYHSMLKEYLETYGYHDIFLIEAHSGNILYTVIKEDDFGTNLINGLYADTHLGELFRKTTKTSNRDFTLLQDFAYYAPSNEVALFVASPIFDQFKLVGALVCQLPIDQIDTIMQKQVGLGETSETLLVSTEDFLLRSNSRFSKENTILKHRVNNEISRTIASSQSGVRTIVEAYDQSAIIAYKPLNILGVQWLLYAKVNEAEAFAIIHHIMILILLIMSIIIVIVASVAFFLGNLIVKPILAITNTARQLAAGNLNQTIKITGQDEIGLMGKAFQQMVVNLNQVIQDIVNVSHGLAEGDLRVTPQAKYQGDFVQIKQAMETAMSGLWYVIEDIVQISQGLAEGNLHITAKAEYQGNFVKIKNALETALSDTIQVIADIVQVSQGLVKGQRVIAKVEYRGNFVEIKNALETASIKLAEATTQNMTQNWLKTGQTQLSEQLSGEQDLVQLAKNAITFLATYLEIPVGLFYLLKKAQGEQKAHLKLIASHAYFHRKGITSEFEVGEGMVGQAALEKKPIHITKVPENYYICIQSGLGKALPRNVLVQPFMFEDVVKGVIELAAFKTITAQQLEFIQQVMPSIGIAVNTAESRSRLKVLLQQSQKQALELQQKQTQLQQQNEELQNQSEELQSQSEELQTQQEELRQTNDELEIRTRELERQQEKIRDKNLALEKTKAEMETAKVAIETKAQELELASKYKSEFLANMSHELRTPLNSLLILAQLLSENQDSHLTEQEIEYAKTIHSAGSDLLTLINEILDLSKVEAGKIEVQIEDMFLSDLVETVEQKFRHLAEKKGLEFITTIAKDLPAILKTDIHRLQQIINNLLSNAFKFTSEGEIKLTIQHPSENFPQIGKKSLDPTEIIAISVADTGIGIPKNKHQVIFEAFQQVDGTTSRRYGGTGLGLSISRQLARLLGGELQLHSIEGKGSTFTLYLPETTPTQTLTPLPVTASMPTEPLDNMVLTQTSVPTSTEVKPLSRITDDRETLTATDKSLLIIEDDHKFSSILIKLAQERNFKCLIAEDGKTGLQLAEEYHPHAIILDVGLPQMDGWTVMEKLKDNPDTRHIPVHFMSASDQGMDAKKMGAIGYLLKPISMAELGEAFNSIEQFLSKTVKNLLVIVDDESRQRNILGIVDNADVNITLVGTLARAMQELQIMPFDSIILDVNVEQHSGIKILEQLQYEKDFSHIPIIIYSERELTEKEEMVLQSCANNLTIKAVKSPERLLDEATLFLHQIETKLPQDKQQMLSMVHNKEAILSHQKVLIVDDDVRNTFALTTFLESKEMEVIVGDNGKEALTLLDENPDIAIVLMDIMMPEMDGYEAMQEIRKQPRFRKLPIIALTAKAMKGDKIKCIEAGASDYLTKPVDTGKLISLMRVWLYR